MAHVHFINSPVSRLFNVSFDYNGSQLSLNNTNMTHDPMGDIAALVGIWGCSFARTTLSVSSLGVFVNMTHFLDFLRTLAGDIFLQKTEYSYEYSILFTIEDDYTRFTNELSDRSRLRVLFTKDDAWTAAGDWLRTEYADERDFCARNHRSITCRDAELASMVRLRYSPDCD